MADHVNGSWKGAMVICGSNWGDSCTMKRNEAVIVSPMDTSVSWVIVAFGGSKLRTNARATTCRFRYEVEREEIRTSSQRTACFCESQLATDGITVQYAKMLLIYGSEHTRGIITDFVLFEIASWRLKMTNFVHDVTLDVLCDASRDFKLYSCKNCQPLTGVLKFINVFHTEDVVN